MPSMLHEDVAHLSFDPQCPVCRASARYAAWLWRNGPRRLVLVPWKEGEPAPAFVRAYDWTDEGGSPPWAPYFESGEGLYSGKLAIQMMHVLQWGRVGYWFARLVAIPGVLLLKRLTAIGRSARKR